MALCTKTAYLIVLLGKFMELMAVVSMGGVLDNLDYLIIEGGRPWFIMWK
jgi:hypothetical protein